MEPPMQFKEQINELTQRYNIIVGEIVKTYPSYKIHTKIKKNSTGYQQNISNLDKLQEDIFFLKNNLAKSTDELQKNIKTIDNKIFLLDEANKKLQTEYDLLMNSDNAAHGRLTDAKTLYQQQLVGNWLFFLSLTATMYMLYKR